MRSELILYGISVHAYFPGTIFSPGLEEENKTKPEITRQIEGTEDGLTPAQCAKGLIKGKFSTRTFGCSRVYTTSQLTTLYL